MMRKWKAEIWMEDTREDENDRYLTQEEIEFAMKKAKEAIENVWTGLKVVVFDAYREAEKTWTVKSESVPNQVYIVSLFEKENSEDKFTCTCSDYMFRKHECKHIKRVKMQLVGEKQKQSSGTMTAILSQPRNPCA
jgi:hypothetical protein